METHLPHSQQTTRHTVYLALLVVILLSAAAACTNTGSYGAAPLGDKATLEKLADAYRNISDNLPVTPTNLSPADRRKFLGQVFNRAGYDYPSTLLALAKVQTPQVNQNHKDLKQLLYLPHFDKRLEALSEIYQPDEIAAITAIDEQIK